MVTTVFEPVIGLEIHAQLLTKSKMFCACSADYNGLPPNTDVCSVCGGMPGALPVINRKAVEYTILTALALNCEIAEVSNFDRKNYSYPDLPKGYQISQYARPLGRNGWLEYRVGGDIFQAGIVRVHLEEDTGKLLHTTVEGRDVTLVDYNRSGVPLMEIVSAPDLHSPEAAREFFASLRQILMYLGVNDGNLQEGSMRADVNVSLRGPEGLPGTKVEIKNLNSFRSVQRALEFEIERQREVLASGGTLVQETRGWSEQAQTTLPQRSKEYAHDYRYFPEPDLPPLVTLPSELRRLHAALPEMPAARLERFQEVYGLSAYTARVLTDEQALAAYYESTVQDATGVPPVTVANWITGDFLRLVNERAVPLTEVPVSAAALAELLRLVQDQVISGAAGKQVLEEMFRTGERAPVIVERLNLAQIADTDALERLVDDVVAAHPGLVETYRRGKTNVLQALVGKTMQASKGKANPARVKEILEEKLAAPV